MAIRRIHALFVAVVLGASPAWALVGVQEAKLVPDDGMSGELFGSDVALDGDMALIGARSDNPSSTYVYTRSNGVWSQTDLLVPDDEPTFFGFALALEGDTAIIGAPQDDHNGPLSGSAYVYERTNGVWSQVDKLWPADNTTQHRFGASVAMDGDLAVIGSWNPFSPQSPDAITGAFYVYNRINGVWTETLKINPSDGTPGDRFSTGLAVDQDTVVAGSPEHFNDGIHTGSAYVYVATNGGWSLQAEIQASDAEEFDHFGEAVDVRGDTIAVGAFASDDHGTLSGSAYVFTRSGGQWTEEQILVPADGVEQARFGMRIALESDTCHVGALGDASSFSGSVYVYTREAGQWTLQTKLRADDGSENESFGSSLDTDGETILVGNAGDYDNGPLSGSAYVFFLTDDDVPVCGNGDLEPFEECDDGNNEDGDGCAADCTLEEPVPAVSYRGVFALALLIVTISTAALLWRRRSAA